MQLRKVIKNFSDVEYNFKLLDRLFKGQGIDGDYIREVPSLKVTGMLQASQLFIGRESVFEEGYDPHAKVAPEDLGEMAYEDAVELAKLGTTLIEGGYLRTGLIDASRIDTGTLNADRIGSNTIVTDHILAKSITTEKINDAAVTSGKLGDSSVITIKLDTGAVTSGKIAANAVTADKIAADAITANKILAGAVTAAKISVVSLGAISADLGSITAGRIYGCSIYGSGLVLRDSAGTERGGFIISEEGVSLISSVDIAFSPNDDTGVIDLRRPSRTRNIVPASVSTFNIGSSVSKYKNGYFDNLPGCPTPTSNSGISVMKKISAPEVRDGKHGRRHYFLDEDFPSEMKCKVEKADSSGNITETDEEEIEYIRTIGVVVQSVRELIDKVEKLERVVHGK